MHSTGSESSFSRLIYYPGTVVKAAALDFSGVIADYLMLNVLAWHGERILKRAEVKPAEWQKTYQALNVITELDPRFFDPYILAETSLPWDAGMVEETNQLLLKGAKALPDNHRPYFFLWFNHYWFLKDPKTAASYLEKAAVIPGAPNFYKTLAARMHYQGGEVTSGIFFLQEMLKESTDPAIRERLKKRLNALRSIVVLERSVAEYMKKFRKRPVNLVELVNTGLLKAVPKDPYGGEFYIMENGRVYTTSKLVDIEFLQQ